MSWDRIGRDAARDFLDFSGARKSDPHWARIAERQLDGTVACFNRLADRRVVWLADEVGMGKTFVALGVAALLRHQHPRARILYLLPSSRLQPKWRKEIHRFTRSIVTEIDHRARTLQGHPCQPLIEPHRLEDLARELVTDPDRDVLAPLSAFSFGLGSEPAKWQGTWRKLAKLSPLLPSRLPADLCREGQKQVFKEVYAAALNLLLPDFDLVICDESHNLKAGARHGAARNRTLAIALGGWEPDIDKSLPWSAPRLPHVQRLLCLTATPVEHDFAELPRQSEVFGLHEERGLPPEVSTELGTLRDPQRAGRKDTARHFVIRRLHELFPKQHTGRQGLTKNLYRREWRHGGMESWDDELERAGPRERLVVALVQKRVLQLLHQRGKASADRAAMPSFQMGMLSSFESFHQTLSNKLEKEQTFDGDDQTRDQDDRKGLDSATVDALCQSYRETFGSAPPHPKMDQAARKLGRWASRGDKSLVFVRRVRTTEELADKVGDELSRWLRERIAKEMPPKLQARWLEIDAAYLAERRSKTDVRPVADSGDDESDTGGADTFFSWFFRGDGQSAHHVNHTTGAWLRRRCFQDARHPWSVFFHDDHVGWLLGDAATWWADVNQEELARRARTWMTKAENIGPRHRFEAWQAAGLQLLEEREGGNVGACARWLINQLYIKQRSSPFEGEIGRPRDGIGVETFFSSLRQHALGELLWPGAIEIPDVSIEAGRKTLHEREVRRELMASTLRLGHPFTDLWATAVWHVGAFEVPGAAAPPLRGLCEALLQRLGRQRVAASMQANPPHTAWRELSLLASQHQLLVDVNFPDVGDTSIHGLSRYFQNHLSRQNPVVAMHGGSKSQQALTQFRMPGYPMVLVSTDVLQEGVDLHTFCGRVVHYGIAHTSSATEQRTGRVDRIASLVHRRMLPGRDETMLQVHYPHLMDTIEPLQLDVLYRRMDHFMKMMHDGLATTEAEPSRIALDLSQQREVRYPEPPKDRLESAFEVQPGDLAGGPLCAAPAIDLDVEIIERLLAKMCPRTAHTPESQIWWGEFLVGDDFVVDDGGEAECEHDLWRRQPATIELRTRRDGEGLLLRVESPIGQLDLSDGRTAGRLLRRQEALAGVSLVSQAPGSRRPWISLRCDLPVNGDLLAKLDHAIEAVCVQADQLEREFTAEGQDLGLDDLVELS